MVLAAGLGTRLLPLTLTRPKALVEVGGKPLIETVSGKLRRAGFRDIVVNTHHLAPMLERWLQGRQGFKVSREEPRLLGTGGAVRQAIPLFGSAERVLFHNVDILSNADLTRFWQAGEGADATLLVSERKTRRYLLFSQDLRLQGWTDSETGELRTPYPDLQPEHCRRLAFSGIHQMRRALWQEMADWPECFSIIDFYLQCCRRYQIKAHLQSGLRLLDAGKTEALQQAEAFLSS
ncbi:MAG: NTP transferase domain-containing protein [Prevotellaceae bacterium]|nr:NTP transferase domain-containing protein [Prevotellaceae bacterium]